MSRNFSSNILSAKNFFQVTSVVFSVLTVMHVLRLLLGWNAVIAGWEVPMGVSAVAALAGGFLAYSAFQLAKKK